MSIDREVRQREGMKCNTAIQNDKLILNVMGTT